MIEIHARIMSYLRPKYIESKAVDTEKSQKETTSDEIVGHSPKCM
jgi:hypothetical protein